MKTKNKRILTYSEFDGEYGNTGKQGIHAGNDQASIDLFKNAPSELEEPTISDDNKIDSIDSKPATNQIKTDYEATPQSPNGPALASNGDDSNDSSVDKKSIDDIKSKFRKSMNKKSKSKIDTKDAPIEDEEEIETRSKTKLTPKQKEELKRETEGEY